MSLLRSVSTGLVAVALLAGCSAPIEGNWRSREKLSNGERNELVVDGEGGELEMYARLGTDELRLFDFDFEWAEEGEEFELRMECDKGCDGQDLRFDLDCTLDEFDLLDCEANQHFTNYGYFEFEQTAD